MPHSVTKVPATTALLRYHTKINMSCFDHQKQNSVIDAKIKQNNAKQTQNQAIHKQHRKAKTITLQPGNLVPAKNLVKTNKLQPFYESPPHTIIKAYPRSAKTQNKKATYIRSTHT